MCVEDVLKPCKYPGHPTGIYIIVSMKQSYVAFSVISSIYTARSICELECNVQATSHTRIHMLRAVTTHAETLLQPPGRLAPITYDMRVVVYRQCLSGVLRDETDGTTKVMKHMYA